MALLWFDGFETYDVFSDMNIVNSFMNGCTANALIGAYGRNGGRGILIGNGGAVSMTFDNNYTTLIFGFAYYGGNLYTSKSNSMLYLKDGTTIQLAFYVISPEIAVYRNVGDLLLGTTSGANLVNGWQYIELKFTIDNSAGAVAIRVNGNQVLNLTNQDYLYIKLL